MYKKYKIVLFISTLLFSGLSIAKEVTVAGFAQVHGSGDRLPDVEVIALEQDRKVAVTNARGEFSFQYPSGQLLTLLFRAANYMSSQSATVKVPEEGFTTKNGFTYQAISHWKFYILKVARFISWTPSLKNDHCQMIVTVAGKGKTLNDNYQGEKGATLLIDKIDDQQHEQAGNYHLCYYGTMPYFYTKPLCVGSTTTDDGGVFVANIPPEDNKVHQITAVKQDTQFTTALFKCEQSKWKTHAPHAVMFINLSPPTGPTVID